MLSPLKVVFILCLYWRKLGEKIAKSSRLFTNWKKNYHSNFIMSVKCKQIGDWCQIIRQQIGGSNPWHKSFKQTWKFLFFVLPLSHIFVHKMSKNLLIRCQKKNPSKYTIIYCLLQMYIELNLWIYKQTLLSSSKHW